MQRKTAGMVRILSSVSSLMAMGSENILELINTYVDKFNRQWCLPVNIHTKRTNKYIGVENGKRECARRSLQISKRIIPAYLVCKS